MISMVLTLETILVLLRHSTRAFFRILAILVLVSYKLAWPVGNEFFESAVFLYSMKSDTTKELCNSWKYLALRFASLAELYCFANCCMHK